MKTYFTKHIILFFLLIISFSIPSNAVIDYKPDVEKNTTFIKKQKKVTKKGLLKRWKKKVFLKKFKKLQKKVDDATILKAAKNSQTIGIASFASLIVGLLTLSLGSWIILYGFLIVAACLAIYGDILSLSVLRNTKHDKEKYKRERRMAKKGLIFSLITGLIPLIAFLIFLNAAG